MSADFSRSSGNQTFQKPLCTFKNWLNLHFKKLRSSLWKFLLLSILIPSHFQINYFLIFYLKPFQYWNAGGPQLANYKKFSYSGVPLNRYVDRDRHKKVFQRKRIMILKFVPYCQRHESILLWNVLEDLVSLETFYLKISSLLFTRLSNENCLSNVA